LPKDERKLLKSYYNKSEKTGEIFELEIYEAMKILGFKANKASALTTDEKWAMVFNANDNLKDRRLINFELENHIFKINLTLNGLDLGRKYNSWWTCSGLWFAEYKHHWIWLIVSFLGGIIGALLVNWLSQNNTIM